MSQWPRGAHELTLARSLDSSAAAWPSDVALAVGATTIDPGSAGPPTGVIWAFDFCNGRSSPVTRADLESPAAPGVFRWVHLNLSDQSSRRWIDDLPAVGGEIADMLFADDGHQHVRLVGETLAFAVHDFEREFDEVRPTRTGVLIVLLTPQLMVTARRHPLFCADVILRRIEAGAVPAGAPAALDLMFSALIEVSKSVMRDLARVVRVAEDALIDFGSIPDSRVFVADRRRAVMLRRQLIGLRSILHRLELNDDLPEAIRPTVEKVVQHIVALDGDVADIYRELQQLREEVDMQTARRTNQNLYVLSTLSALLLPPTLVSSFFGMNTGGLPWLGDNNGSLWAFFLMVLATAAVIAWLYRRGFFLNGR